MGRPNVDSLICCSWFCQLIEIVRLLLSRPNVWPGHFSDHHWLRTVQEMYGNIYFHYVSCSHPNCFFFPLPPAPSPILTCLMSWQPTAFLIVCACQQNPRTAWGILINIHLFASNHPPTYFAVAFTNWSKCPTTVPLYLIWWAIIERYDRHSAYTCACAQRTSRTHI